MDKQQSAFEALKQQVKTLQKKESQYQESEAALRRSQKMLERTEEVANVGSWEWEIATDTVTWSRGLYRIFQYDPGNPAPGWIEHPGHCHPDDREILMKAVEAAVTTGAPYEIEIRAFRKDGNLRTCLARGFAEMGPNGTAERLFGFIQDITEKKTADELGKLQSLVLDQISDRVIVTDLDGYITYVNAIHTRTIGTSKEALIGQHVTALGDDPEKGASQMEILQKTLRDGSWRGEVINFRPDNTPLTVDCRTQMIRNDAGHPIALCGIATDITERRRAQEEARKTLNFLEFAVEQIPIPIIIAMAPDVTITNFNQAALDLMTKKPENLKGVSLKDFQEYCPTFYPDGTPCRVEDLPLVRAVQQGEEVRNVEMIVRPGNDERWISASAAPLKDKDGKLLAGIVAFPDITDKKRFEAEKLSLEEQFHQAQKLESVSRLAGGAAHDLNNLLSPILGFSEMVLNDTAPDDPRRELLEDVLKAARRARDLVGQLLAFSRKQPLVFNPLNLNDLLTDFETLLCRTIREDITIHIELEPSLPLIKGDAGHVEQVVMNLVINAQDAMPGGGHLTIHTKRVELAESPDGVFGKLVPGDYVVMSIKDTGVGMDEKILEHLFEPFFTTKDVNQGTGLGLATVYGVIKQHGGNIQVDSRPGQGTSFRVYLPVLTEPVAVDTRYDPTEPPVHVAGGSETILVVEDNEPMRKMAEIMLARQGYNILTAKNGWEALSLLGQNDGSIDLLLTDIIMPGMNGVELYHQAVRKHPGLKAVYMSGYTDDVIAHHDVLNGNVPFLQKPFTNRSLVEKIREAVER